MNRIKQIPSKSPLIFGLVVTLAIFGLYTLRGVRQRPLVLEAA